MSQDKVLDQAEAALQQSDLQGAERALLGMWPDINTAPGDAKHVLALVRAAQQRFADAEQLMRAAVAADASSLRHAIGLGHILTAAFNPAGAAEAYAAALRIDPNWPGLTHSYARAAYRAGRYAEAETAVRQIINTAPDAAAWGILARILSEQGKGGEALAAAAEALKLDPANAGALQGKAAAEVAMGRAQDALATLEQLRAGGVEDGVVLTTHARALEQLGRRADADKAFADAAARWPNDPVVQRALASRR